MIFKICKFFLTQKSLFEIAVIVLKCKNFIADAILYALVLQYVTAMLRAKYRLENFCVNVNQTPRSCVHLIGQSTVHWN